MKFERLSAMLFTNTTIRRRSIFENTVFVVFFWLLFSLKKYSYGGGFDYIIKNIGDFFFPF